MSKCRFSILVPTRKRPHRLSAMYETARSTAHNPEDIELVYYVDEDDHSYDELDLPNSLRVDGPRKVLAQCWNDCWKNATGEYLGLIGDDIAFHTQDWDLKVDEMFQEQADRIMYVFGDDGTTFGKSFGTHGFIHQNWAKTLGYFVPPYFVANYVDRWLNLCAESVGRLRYGGISLEHNHRGFNKAPDDETYRDGYKRFGDAEAEWFKRQDELEADKQKLKEFIDAYPNN